MSEAQYNPESEESILSFALRLKGRTLRECLGDNDEIQDYKGKGGFGQLVESAYFGLKTNSRPTPDFEIVGIELKVSPLKRNDATSRRTKYDTEFVPKERMRLAHINYERLSEETWDDCHLMQKCSKMLVILYLYDKESDRLDYPFIIVCIWEFPEEDLSIIRNDWETIKSKVDAGFAHLISGGDTRYLEAAPQAQKGTDRTTQPFSEITATPRAFALKPCYIQSIVERELGLERASMLPRSSKEKKLDFEKVIENRFLPFVGQTEDELLACFELSKRSKGRFALISARIMGVDSGYQIAELKRAGMKMRTVRVKQNGTLKESISFSAFKYLDLVDQDWEDSDFYYTLTQRFLFVVWKLDSAGRWVFEGIRFWAMPANDIEIFGRECFERTVECIRSGDLRGLPRSTDNKCCHVRPHARNAEDTNPLPNGIPAVKRSLWLNAIYMGEQLGFRSIRG